jgi:hypothetical protein
VSVGEAREIIAAIRSETEQAADSMLCAVEKGLRDLAGAREGRKGALDSVEEALCTIMEVCAFQDLTGQRLSRLESMIADMRIGSTGGDPLLNGPALPGTGLDQAAADDLFRRSELGASRAAGGGN